MRKSNNPFASKEYLFLLWLSEHQLTVGGKPVVKYSQKELAAEYGSCETTVNRWLATLREVECSYGRKWTMEKMKESIIKLPAKADGSPDFEFMETYIKTFPYSDRI